MNLAFFLGLGLFLSCQAVIGGERLLPPRILRDHVSDGLSELEFLPNGRLLSYQVTFDLVNPLRKFLDPPRTSFEPREMEPFLTIEPWKWKVQGGKLMIWFGHEWAELPYVGAPGSYMIWEHDLDEEEHLQFFDLLTKYCAIPPRQGESKGPRVAKNAEAYIKPPFRFLHTATENGFVEYELRSDGRAVAYYDLEKGPVNKYDNPSDSALLRFKVEAALWRQKGSQILVDNGGIVEVLQISANGREITSKKGTWRPVERLEFIPRIFSFCEKPLPKEYKN